MLKLVRYNGGTKSHYVCNSPTNLVVGRLYEVIEENKREKQTEYVLKGLKGFYNSEWFDDVYERNNVFIGISKELPVIGKRYKYLKVEVVNGIPKTSTHYTENVKNFSMIGNNIYRVLTHDSLYIIQIG